LDQAGRSRPYVDTAHKRCKGAKKDDGDVPVWAGAEAMAMAAMGVTVRKRVAAGKSG